MPKPSNECPNTHCRGGSYLQSNLDHDDWKIIPKSEQNIVYAAGRFMLSPETMRCSKCGCVYLKSGTESRIVGHLDDNDNDGVAVWTPARDWRP